MKINRERVIRELSELETEDPDFDPVDYQDYAAKSDEELIEDYCLSGLFANNFSGVDENDIEGLE